MEFTGAIMLSTIPNLLVDAMLEAPFEESVCSTRYMVQVDEGVVVGGRFSQSLYI